MAGSVAVIAVGLGDVGKSPHRVWKSAPDRSPGRTSGPGHAAFEQEWSESGEDRSSHSECGDYEAGQPCIEAEHGYLKALAEEMRHSRLPGKSAKAALEAVVKADPELQPMAATIGLVTTAILIGLHRQTRVISVVRKAR